MISTSLIGWVLFDISGSYHSCRRNDVADDVHDCPQCRLRAMSPKQHRQQHPQPPTMPSACHVTQTTSPTTSTTTHDAFRVPRHPNNVANAIDDHPQCHPRATSPQRRRPPPMMPSMCHVTQTTSQTPSTTPTTPSACHVMQTTSQTPLMTTHNVVDVPCHQNDVADNVHDHPRHHPRTTSPQRRPQLPMMPSTHHVTQTMSRMPSTTPHDALCLPRHANDVADAIHHPSRCPLPATSSKRRRRCCPPPPTTPSVCHVTKTMPWTPSITSHDVFRVPRYPNHVANAAHHLPWCFPHAMSPKRHCGCHPLPLPFLTTWSYIPGKYPLL